jgi:MHS family proline/betaine transporter-like MFS transporter
LFGIVVAFFGAYLRYGIDDSDSGTKPAKQPTTPLMETLAKHKKTITHIVFINAFGGCLFYILNTFLHNYFKISGLLSAGQSLCTTSIVSMFTTIAIPIGGLLSDKFGRKKIMLMSVYGFLLCIWPMFLTLKPHLMYTHLIFESIIGFCNGLFWGGRAAFYAETFPRHLRCTAVALAFGISHSLFAGTAPFISEFLVAQTGSCYSVGIFIVILAILAIYSLSKLEDRTAKELQ